MPKKVEECVESLKNQGYSEDKAWAICQDQFGAKTPEKVENRDERFETIDEEYQPKTKEDEKAANEIVNAMTSDAE